MNNYYKELQENYEKYYEIDAKNNKIGIILNILAVLLAIGVMIPFVFIYDFKFEVNLYTALLLLILAVSLVLYMVLHELVPGLVYNLMTHLCIKENSITCSICTFCGIYSNIFIMYIFNSRYNY